MAWDLSGPVPAVAAIVRHGQEYKVVRIGLDGREELLALGPHEWLPLACGRGGIAVRANGDVVLADSDNHRILLIPRHPPVETLAGRRPSPLDPGRWTGLELNFPCGIAATAGGDIVFADRGNHLVRRITPDGRLETLAGTLHLLGNVSREVRNDLRRIHPATATALWSPEGVAAAPDGRIVFVDGRPAVFELHPDGTLRRLDREGSLRRLDEDPTVVHGVTVTADNQVVCVAADNRVCRIAPDGGLVPLAGAGPAGSGPGTEAWALPAPGGGIRFPALLGVAAGPGGVLAYAPGPEAWFVGPEKGDDHLAGRVRTAVAAALEQRLDQAGPVRASLDTWAKACPPSADAVAGLRLGTLACGGLPVLGGVKALERLVCAYLREDHRGHWVRARVALGTLDREVRRRSPEAADQLAAWTPST
jgi:hypothetical protein